MFTDELREQAKALLDKCKGKKLTIATAESCTGGLISALLTEIPGSSAVVERGFVTYSNQSKTDLLGVDAALIAQHGAVSYEVANAMAAGALERAKTDLAVSVTGIAGPDGGTPQKPVGLVYIGVANKNGVSVERNFFSGNRDQVRAQAVSKALSLLSSSVI